MLYFEVGLRKENEILVEKDSRLFVYYLPFEMLLLAILFAIKLLSQVNILNNIGRMHERKILENFNILERLKKSGTKLIKTSHLLNFARNNNLYLPLERGNYNHGQNI